MEIAARSAVIKLQEKGHAVKWLGYEKYVVDGERLTLTELLKLAAYGKTE